MPLAHYGVLVGRVVESRAEGGSDTPHFQIRVHADGTDFRVAVNVLSQQAPSELLYVADEAFRHPQTQGLASLALGPGLADADDRGEAGPPRGFRLLPDQHVSLAMVRAALGMADDDGAGPRIRQHFG